MPPKGLRPLFKWFGSKWSSAKHYPPPLEGVPIFEPKYAGSAGYSLRYADRQVVIWDANPMLQALWCWLIDCATETSIREIPINIPPYTDIRSLGLTYGQQLLLKHWQRTNNVGDCWTTSAWGNKSGQWTANTRARVAEEVYGIKHWRFQRIMFALPGTYFLDPPYFYNYRYGFHAHDYDQLVHEIAGIPTGSRIIVCEAVCPKTGLIPDYLPFKPSHRQVTSRRKATNNHHSRELVYLEDR